MDKKLNAAEGAYKKILKICSADIVIGIGTGSTTDIFTQTFLPKLRNRITKVYSSSHRSTKLLHSLGFTVVESLPTTQCIDIYVDGADEIDIDLNLIKGGGGAHFREKILTKASSYFLCIADDSKKVKALGRFGIPVEIDTGRLDHVKKELLKHFPEFSQRDTISDNGNVLADLGGKILDEPIKFEKMVNGIEGVVEVGIFALDKPNLAIIGLKDGYELMESSIA
jgi:ribose 5-phosphate isomerase A